MHSTNAPGAAPAAAARSARRRAGSPSVSRCSSSRRCSGSPPSLRRAPGPAWRPRRRRRSSRTGAATAPGSNAPTGDRASHGFAPVQARTHCARTSPPTLRLRDQPEPRRQRQRADVHGADRRDRLVAEREAGGVGDDLVDEVGARAAPPASRPPPSQSTRVRPRSPSRCSSAGQVELAVGLERDLDQRRAALGPGLPARPARPRRGGRATAASRPRSRRDARRAAATAPRSTTTRTGRTSSRPRSRTSSRGSSLRAVPAPTSTASDSRAHQVHLAPRGAGR